MQSTVILKGFIEFVVDIEMNLILGGELCIK